MGADDFYYRYVKKVDQKPRQIATELHKLAFDAPQELDELMREASEYLEIKDGDLNSVKTRSSRPAQKKSKKDRQQLRVLRKL